MTSSVNDLVARIEGGICNDNWRNACNDATDALKELVEQFDALQARYDYVAGAHDTWRDIATKLQEQFDARAADAALWERDWHRAQKELRVATANADKRRDEDATEIQRLSRLAEKYRQERDEALWIVRLSIQLVNERDPTEEPRRHDG